MISRWFSAFPLILLEILSAPAVSAAIEGKAEHGKRMYEKSCIACHTTDGAGDYFKAAPALAGQRPKYLR
jgi:mono/diheme cytochrome c family protein